VTSSELRWPQINPRSGPVCLRPFRSSDASMVEELATDAYVPLIGSLPAHADTAAATAWIGRQHARLADDIGFSFCIADEQDQPLGFAGLWTRGLPGGRATAGYAVRPSARGRGAATHALMALTAFGWTLPNLDRIELYVEPGNLASRRTAERAGYRLEGVLRQHQEIAGSRRDMCLYAVVRENRKEQPPER
jgi:ribosomal-protein-alanine N-acetyltransferase